jgi:hypothetical protein
LSGNFELIWIVEFWSEAFFVSVAKSAARTGFWGFHARTVVFAARVVPEEWPTRLLIWWTG